MCFKPTTGFLCNCRCNRPIISKLFQDYNSDAVVLYVKYQNDWRTEMDVMD